jgi:signal peptidase I
MDSLLQYSDELKEVVKRPRKAATQTLNLGTVVFSALMLWKGLMLVTGSESPVVVVLSGSMEPGFHRGDILFLALTDAPFMPGDVTVFSIEGRDIPIVHRAHSVHENNPNEHLALVTKGDNNRVDDRGLYNPGQLFLNKKNLIGRAYAFIPYVGMVTIWLNDFPWLKYVLIGAMAFFVMIGRE